MSERDELLDIIRDARLFVIDYHATSLDVGAELAAESLLARMEAVLPPLPLPPPPPPICDTPYCGQPKGHEGKCYEFPF